ncbi:hypothetical protein [Cryptosporangium sp. NPDC051539]|uniref:hypothetical protein n=1 Tax=Cryptosporangium sp. NPDC051539 TaxID=3363962 RepID=UPI0037AE0181
MANTRGHWDQLPGWTPDPEDTADGAAPGFGGYPHAEDIPDQRPVDPEDAVFDAGRPDVEEYLPI